MHIFSCEISQLCEFCKDSRNALFNCLFVGLNDQFGMFWLLVRIVNAREILDFALVNELVEPLDVTLTADFNRTLDIDFDKVTDLFSCPLTRLIVRGNGSRNAHDSITREQAADKGDTLNVGIPVL